MTDTVLCIGATDAKLSKMLEKLGYRVLEVPQRSTFSDIPSTELIDIVLFEAAENTPLEEAVSFLRSQPLTRAAAAVILSTDAQAVSEMQKARLESVEFMSLPYSIGTLASRVATQLRMRKIKGQDASLSTVAEANAALRDMNTRYAKDLEEARQIQASLLPQGFPEDERYDISVYYKPLEEVGGDWYNVRRESSGKISAQVADVSGHGLAAAFLGSMAKLGFSAVSKEMPDELLDGMNRLMTPQMPSGRFVTMCGFLFDPDTGHIDFARAGHQPALVLDAAKKEVSELIGEGFAIGFFEESFFSRVESVLSPSDVIVIFSDGLVEAQNRDQKTYGMEGVAESLRKSVRMGKAQAVMDRIIGDFEAFLDGRVLKDDVTVLVLMRCA